MSRLFYILAFVTSVFVTDVSYADDYMNTKITPQERAVFAFFRAAEVPPDYDFWIKSTRPYEDLPSDYKKEDYFVKESVRLGRGFGSFDPDVDLLEINTNIVSRYHEPEEGQSARISFKFFGLDENSTPTFNFPFGAGYISMILNRLDYFSDLKLSEKEHKEMSAKVPYLGDEFDATLHIHAKVHRADYENKILQNDVYNWPMFAKIGYIKCVYSSAYNQDDTILWEYLAPWYEEQFNFKNMPEEEKYPHPYDLFKD